MAAVEEEDPAQVRAAQILASLRFRKLRRWPEWVPMQPSGEASSSPTGTVAATAAAKVMPPLRTRQPERVSMQPGVAPFAGTAVAAGVPERWPKAKRTGARGGETSREQQGHAAAAAAAPAAKGSVVQRSNEQERCSAEMPAASAQPQRQPVVAALCYAAVAVAGPGTGPSTASAAPGKEPMKTPSPISPLDYGGAGGSGAPSSADDPALARPQAKRKGTGAPGSVDGEGEGCSSPSKRVPVVAEEEKPVPISVEPSAPSETGASSGKGAPRPFDLNLLPCPLDEDDDGCPDTI